MNISKWGECNIDLKPSDHKVKMLVKETGLVAGFNEGKGLDMSIKITKPIPFIDFDYDSKLVNAYHQPELTSLQKIRSSCPNYGINSIAFYHANKRGNEYKAGKIGHLYRHKLVDAHGNWVWTNWTKERNGIIRLWLDTLFLKMGTPPFQIVPVGDTFGYTSIGVLNFIKGSTYILAGGIFFAPAAAGSGVSMSIYGYSANTPHVKMAVYDAVLNPVTINLIANATTDEFVMTDTAGVPQWWTVNFTVQPSFPIANYNPCFENDASFYAYYDAAADDDFFDIVAYGAWPNPMSVTAGNLGNVSYSIYVTYIPSGGGVVAAIPLGFIQGR